MKTTNEIIRGLREDRDLNQSAIASVLNISQQQYSRYENDASELPLRALTVLADYYGVSTDYLIGRKDGMFGVPGLDKKLTRNYTAGNAISDILSLSVAGRMAVVEYIALQKMKETCENKIKDGSQG